MAFMVSLRIYTSERYQPLKELFHISVYNTCIRHKYCNAMLFHCDINFLGHVGGLDSRTVQISPAVSAHDFLKESRALQKKTNER